MPFQRGAILALLALVLMPLSTPAQSGNAGTIRGTVTDPSGAVIPNATVHLSNERSGFDRTATSDATGQFIFPNVAFNPYTIHVSAKGFAPLSQNSEIGSVVGTSLKLVLQISGAVQTVTVESQGDLVEDDPTFHVDVDRDMFNKVPLESASSHSQFSGYTLTTPGVACRILTASSMASAIMLPNSFSTHLLPRRRPIHHRSAKQDLLQSASFEFDSVHRSHQRCSAS